MTPDSIQREIVIEAPVDLVWRALTEPEQLASWFSDEADLDMRPGGGGTMTWTDRATNTPMVVPISVQALDAPSRFAYRWVHPEGEEANATNSLLVEIAIAPAGEGTRITLTESGFAEIAWSEEQKAEVAERQARGWVIHLSSLRDYALRQLANA
ncbi:MAG TPA: SRPBCC domain-containing protein [Conexibacter sp.]|nr:SRPBCC domain-containing protein [Conexibacter sp.]